MHVLVQVQTDVSRFVMGETLPLFPLHTVLFPGSPLPLRIFETRYLDMVSACLKADRGFGVCLIATGREVGEAARTVEVGTMARIADWQARSDGLLGITAHGERRFRIRSVQVQPDLLAVAEVEWLPDPEDVELPVGHCALAEVLRRLIAQAGPLYAGLPERYNSASWVANRLADLLPLSHSRKQYLLELDDPLQRLDRLHAFLQGLEIV